MALKKAQFIIKGMSRDLTSSKFNPEYAYENHNLRIVATDDNDTLSLVNERGNKISKIFWEGEHSEGDFIYGVPIGQEIIDDNLVLFTTDGEESIDIEAESNIPFNLSSVPVPTEELYIGADRIYKFWLDEDKNLHGLNLYTGSLNFSVANPIETLGVYENDKLKKVYWTDGLNQPRVINISANSSKRSHWNNSSFDFIRKLKLKESISIERNTVASGLFAPGTIQYCFTYFDLYGQESNIFYTSPLYYTSYNDRGASPDDTISNSFNITLEGLDSNFEYVRIYSLLRTSINGTPQLRKVIDLAISDTAKLTYTDTGVSGESLDPTILLYIGGEEIIAGTLSQKDNTLFLGDLKHKRQTIDDSIVQDIREESIEFNNNRSIRIPGPTGLYPYENLLHENSNVIKTFKYLEWYRFGLQFQHFTGKWSEPVWIEDAVNNKSPKFDNVMLSTDKLLKLPQAQYYLTGDIIKKLISNGYLNVRPVIVLPDINDRSVICQGVLAPTVFNVGDRAGKAPFSQASWFFRPNSYLDVEKASDVTNISVYNPWNFTNKGPSSKSDHTDSIAAQVTNQVIAVPGDTSKTADTFNRGKWAEFRHHHPIPSNTKENSEIQCIYNPPATPNISSSTNITEWVSDNAENFYIDQSIVTLHSPDIEFDSQLRSLDMSKLKLRIVGYANITACANDISITASTPVNNFCEMGAAKEEDRKYFTEFPIGEYKEYIGTFNNLEDGPTNNPYGWRSMLSGGFWIDDMTAYEAARSNPDKSSTGFVVYPWHRSGSYNNTTTGDSTGNKTAKVGKKKMSILRYSWNVEYLDNIWKAEDENLTTYRTGISDVGIFDSNEISLLRLKGPKYSSIDSITYYGNIDKVITYPRVGTKKDGYPIVYTKLRYSANTLHELLASNYDYHGKPGGQDIANYTKQYMGMDPVSIKYKSTPHAVIVLNYDLSGTKQNVLPTNQYEKYFIDPEDPEETIHSTEVANSVNAAFTNSEFFWDSNCSGIHQDVLSVKPNYGYLWIGELYNDSVTEDTRFGGKTQEALENNIWLPAGAPVSLSDNNSIPKDSLNVIWTEGDTYYQRYDCLKTYPFSTEDQNSVVDILSFMVETRVNLDGRYDRNRGQSSNLNVSPTNFNLLNTAYSQKNNFFSYRLQGEDKLVVDNFPNTITWSKTKTFGEETDTWTNITLASTLDLDGDKGSVRAIRNFNDSVLVFQDDGISQVLYNENVQIASTTGVPIEIANSGKVSGKRYITNHIGCTNKWSICTTPAGIYFLDSIRKDFYLFNGQFNNLSDSLGFHSWTINTIPNTTIWNPKDFDSCVTLYDRVNNDVFITTKDTALAYSETLGQFSSFYDYGNTPYFGSLEDTGIAWHINSGGYYSPWLHREGKYNSFFGEAKPFWTTVIVNPDATKDKVFNTLEYRADSFNGSKYLSNFSFDTLNTWNEHQEGLENLVTTTGTPSNLKKKFRVWRANIPRWNVDKNGQTANNRDRMRNPWLYLKLSMELDDNINKDYKTVLHDLVVDYFE